MPSSQNPLTFQELILRLQNFWADQGCVLQQPYDVEVGAGTMAPETRALAMQMFRLPLESFAGEPWTQQQHADLRRYLLQIIERHVEKKLVTAVMLNKL